MLSGSSVLLASFFLGPLAREQAFVGFLCAHGVSGFLASLTLSPDL